jgi:hypothetical protein
MSILDIPIEFQQNTLKEKELEYLIRKKLLNIDIDKDLIDEIMLTLERDVKLLKELKFMDYSLLLGVENVNEMNSHD